MADKRVITYQSKQVAFDKQSSLELTEGEADYFVICLTPLERWLVLTLLEFYTIFDNRWRGEWTETEKIDLPASTLERLICPMACSDDIQAVIQNLALINQSILDISSKIGPSEADINARLTEIKAEIEGLKVSVDNAFPVSIFDQVEEVLNGVGVIMGAPSIPVDP